MFVAFDAINIDELSDDPADIDATADALTTLGLYARLKAKAMRARLEGRLKVAAKAEREADAVYVTLPEWAQW